MRRANGFSVIALFLVPFAGCSEPAQPAPVADKVVTPAPVEAPAPAPVAVPEPEVAKVQEPLVARAEIEKAAALYKVLHDQALDAQKKQDGVDVQMEANGWTEESYQALLYDITADAPSRAAYLALTGVE